MMHAKLDLKKEDNEVLKENMFPKEFIKSFTKKINVNNCPPFGVIREIRTKYNGVDIKKEMELTCCKLLEFINSNEVENVDEILLYSINMIKLLIVYAHNKGYTVNSIMQGMKEIIESGFPRYE